MHLSFVAVVENATFDMTLLLTEQAACRAASEHVTSHVSNNWPAREVCNVFYFPAADSLKC